jgi:hypothetical protein
MPGCTCAHNYMACKINVPIFMPVPCALALHRQRVHLNATHCTSFSGTPKWPSGPIGDQLRTAPCHGSHRRLYRRQTSQPERQKGLGSRFLHIMHNSCQQLWNTLYATSCLQCNAVSFTKTQRCIAGELNCQSAIAIRLQLIPLHAAASLQKLAGQRSGPIADMRPQHICWHGSIAPHARPQQQGEGIGEGAVQRRSIHWHQLNPKSYAAACANHAGAPQPRGRGLPGSNIAI